VKLGSGFHEVISKTDGTYLFTGFLSGIDTDVWISPINTAPKLKDLLNNAKYSIYGEWYLISTDEVKDILKTKAKLGVKVRIMLEESMFGGDSSAYRNFKKDMETADIQLKTDRDLGINFLHVKAAVIDKTTAYISTSNLTHSSLHKNREYMVVTQNTGIASSLASILDKDRQDVPLLKKDIHQNLSVCPIDCREKLEYLI
jgi:phosphatidylserine/phosphatidylglycerophosphate/cardiolipin synthase-like enzyme